MGILAKIFGTKNEKLIKQMQPTVARINDLELSMKKLSDDNLKAKTAEFKQRLDNKEPLDALLPEAFAACREAGFRTLGQRHYDVQLMGGLVLHQGKIAEMKTGEGKTLTATLPCYLYGLFGKGAHVITVNDYLAKRDAEWMSAIYKFMNLSTGTIVHGLDDSQRKQAYACDITYGTNNEFGFDYLRDNMKSSAPRVTQRGHQFAIVDEVDSILIDEARTPLIISGPTETNIDMYKKVNTVIPGVQKDVDYIVDEKSRTVSLTEDGISKMEQRLRLDNLYDPKHNDWLHHLQIALRAHILFKKDVDYVVRNGQIIIVDEFTGRLMQGRRYSDGLHGALEAKEHVDVQQESQTLATITFQNYFRLYKTLSGMTGTADTEAVEFHKIYKLDVVVLPTNKKLIRADKEDNIFRTAREKYIAIADQITDAQQKGQPVLVGTVSVEKSELLATLLQRRNIPYDILNAKNHAREASIIANAGKKGHVTIATNMAGRGTDIVLGEGVKEAGGLFVIGTERHESRRIDNQLRGRSGRQGDPGRTQFFLSLEDDLMRIFASDKLSGIMSRLGMKEGEAIVSPMVTRAIEKAQKRVEEQNFSSRKNLIEYDDVMNQQRQVVYSRRRAALLEKGDMSFMWDHIHEITRDIVHASSPEELNSDSWDLKKITHAIEREFNQKIDITTLGPNELTLDQIVDTICKQMTEIYTKKFESLGEENQKKLESLVYLQTIDQSWKEHLLAMDQLKESVSLRGYGQRDPLQEYKKEAFKLFTDLIIRIEDETCLTLNRMPPPQFAQEQTTEIKQTLEQKDKEAPLTFNNPSASPSETNSPNAAATPSQNAEPFQREGKKVGRNDPCPCGSEKKYKKCCGKEAL